jgi:hypothetical protein
MNRPKQREIEEDIIRLSKGGADIDTLLRLMRERGLSQIDSHLMLVKATGIGFAEAQKLVFESEVWADRREVNAKLQEDLAQALLELSQENDPNFKIEVEWEPESPEDDKPPDEKH